MRRLLLLVAACGGGPASPADAGGAADAAPALEARAGASRYALVGEAVTLDGAGSIGAASYQWDFGNGERWPEPRAEAAGTMTYAAPGRYHAVLTVFDGSGDRDSDEVTISVTWPPAFTPRQSGTIVALPGGGAAVASTDANELVVLNLVSYPPPLWAVTRIPVCQGPATVARWGDHLALPCPDADAVTIVDADGGNPQVVDLPWGSRPFGAVQAPNGALYVSLQGSGALAILDLDVGNAAFVAGFISGVDDARAVALLPDGRIAVARWRSPDGRGLISLVSPAPPGGAIEEIELAFDPQISSDTEIGGVPALLDQVLVSPTGREAAVPSLMANTTDGLFRNGRPLTFETLVRAAVSYVDLDTRSEVFERRKQFDNRGRATAGAWSARGDYLYVVMPGNRGVSRVDVLAGGELAGALADVGFAPRGVAVSDDEAYLFVDAWLSREVVIYDVASFTTNAGPIARAGIVGAEPLPAQVLRGKQLFNDSFDTRISRDGYVACAVCHADGDADRLTWDVTQLGEGVRNTISLLGRAGAGDGPIHWSGNFDEIQDFEHPIRELFEGTGLMTDKDFHTGTRDQTLGEAKAGASADLDALAAYVTSLAAPPRSPHREPGGFLSDAALRGQAIFDSAQAGCATCHSGARFTDSAFLAPAAPNLHDVGTLGPGSGSRLGMPLSGLDTPTLIGLWGSAPYLHDGSAPTLVDVLTARNPGDTHGSTSQLSPAELDDLAAYLLSL